MESVRLLKTVCVWSITVCWLTRSWPQLSVLTAFHSNEHLTVQQHCRMIVLTGGGFAGFCKESLQGQLMFVHGGVGESIVKQIQLQFCPVVMFLKGLMQSQIKCFNYLLKMKGTTNALRNMMLDWDGVTLHRPLSLWFFCIFHPNQNECDGISLAC